MIGRVLDIPSWLRYVHEYDFGPLAPALVVLHHTYKPTADAWRGLDTMQAMQTFYRGKGWNAAPHIYCAPDGIWRFTPMSQIGIHAGTGNGSLRTGWYSIGVEMVGSFDQRRPAGAVWDYAKAVMGGLSRRLHIPPRQLISFHRDYTNQKSCPGRAVTKEWVWGEVTAWRRLTDVDYWRRLWGYTAPYHHNWAIPGAWRANAERLGAVRSAELWTTDGLRCMQWFVGGAIVFEKQTGATHVIVTKDVP